LFFYLFFYYKSINESQTTVTAISLTPQLAQQEVYVQLLKSADKVTVRAFAAKRRPAAAPLLSIDIACPPDPQQQTRRSGVQRLGQTDGQTDTVPLHRPCCILCEQCT